MRYVIFGELMLSLWFHCQVQRVVSPLTFWIGDWNDSPPLMRPMPILASMALGQCVALIHCICWVLGRHSSCLLTQFIPIYGTWKNIIFFLNDCKYLWVLFWWYCCRMSSIFILRSHFLEPLTIILILVGELGSLTELCGILPLTGAQRRGIRVTGRDLCTEWDIWCNPAPPPDCWQDILCPSHTDQIVLIYLIS